MLKKLLIPFVVLGLLAGLVACGENVPPKGSHDPVKPAPIASANSGAQSASSVPVVPAASSVSSATSAAKTESSAPADRELDVVLMDANSEYKFNPEQLTFTVGETVKLNLTSQSEFHSFTVDDLDMDIEVEAETTESITFTFDKPGTYDIICIPHESLGMVGTIVVQ